MARVFVWVLPLLLLGMAGCTSAVSEEAAPAATSDVDAGQDPNATAAGSISGLVLTQDQMPLAGADVALLELALEARTAADGSFTFRNVGVGTYSLLVQRLGYESASTRVDVSAAGTSEVQFELVAIRIADPYHYSLNHRVRHVVGEVYVDFVLASTLGDNNTCQACVWTFELPEKHGLGVWEIYGEHTIANPAGGTTYVYFYGDGTLFWHADRSLPFYYEFDDLDDPLQQMRLDILCGYTWVCVEENRDVWYTAFYDTDEVPEGFLAGVPPG